MSKRQIRGSILVIVGILMVLAAVGLHIMQEKRDALAGENARILLQQLSLSRVSVEAVTDADLPETPISGSISGTVQKENKPVDTTMPEKEYLGYSMIGTLRVPSVGIELPILSSWSYTLLDVAPCRYSGSIPGGDMILMGHNYKSHFTPLHQVSVGAEVEFEDVNGVIYRYVVTEIETLHRDEGEQLSSDYPLTLFTCTYGGQNRTIVRCDTVPET